MYYILNFKILFHLEYLEHFELSLRHLVQKANLSKEQNYPIIQN